MLSAPWIVGPITPCSRYVRVENLLPRATVRLFRDGGLQLGESTSMTPWALIPLDAGIEVEPGWEITATQEKDGEVSEPSPLPYRVLTPPTLEALGQPFLLAPAVECGVCLSLGGLVPGSTVTVTVGSQPPVTTVADWTILEVSVPAGIGPSPITVSQRPCGFDRPTTVALPGPLALDCTGRALPAPAFEPAPLACQQVLHLTGIQPGARVSLERGDGNILTACFGFVEGEFVLPDRGLEPGEALTIWQEYDDGRECRRAGERRMVEVDPGPPEMPVVAARPSTGDAFLTIGGLVPGATLHLFRDDETEPFLIAAATRRTSAINLPAGWTARRLRVRQATCTDGPFSEAAMTRVVTASPLQPRLVEPLLACAAAAAASSTGLDPAGRRLGLAAGTLIRVASQRWHGVIGEAVAHGDAFTDVDLWLPLTPDDRITVEATRAGETRRADAPAIVEPSPAMVSEPELALEVDDCTGTIPVSTEPGTIIDLEWVETPALPLGTAGILLASVRAGRQRMTLPVPPLEPGILVRARARRCEARSGPSATATVVDRHPIYETDSTVRICQLTGAADPAGRPHLNDTRGISLSGTDLGIPVDHRDRLWFFFGDAAGFEFGPIKTKGDHDPFGWTEDEPEPDGPRLEIIADDTDFFLKLLEEAIGAVSGGIVGGVVGALVTQVKLAGVIAGATAGAALGALVGWLIDIVPDKEFRRLAVQGLPDLNNFEVPTGGFSFEDQLYLFIAREKVHDPWEGRMRVSHLAVNVGADPANNFRKLHDVSAMLRTIGGGVPPAHLKSSDFGAGEWLVHVAPVRVRNAEWPGLPSALGDGLLLFGTGLYHSSNVRLAWAPLTPGQPPPSPIAWRYYMGEGKPWFTPAQIALAGGTPPPTLLPNLSETFASDGKPPPGLGELSVSWSSRLRRWIMTSGGGDIRFARRPQGPWSDRLTIFDGNDLSRAADNIAPDGSRVWVGLTPTDESVKRPTVAYAPYHVPSWTRVDRAYRELTLYYTLSVDDPPYNPQLMRSRLRGP